MPTVPPGIDDHATSLTVIPQTASGGGTATLVNCVDQSNGLAPPLGTFCSNPAGSPVVDSITFTAGAQADNVSGQITSLSAPYSMSQELTVTFTAPSQILLQTNQTLTPIPEPASVVLVGMPLVGIVALSRRKAARSREIRLPGLSRPA